MARFISASLSRSRVRFRVIVVMLRYPYRLTCTRRYTRTPVGYMAQNHESVEVRESGFSRLFSFAFKRLRTLVMLGSGSVGVPTGIRTPVLTVKGWCPRPLDDGDAGRQNVSTIPRKSGGARRDRTADLLHAMQALSQLSYDPTWRRRTLPDGAQMVKKLNGLGAPNTQGAVEARQALLAP